MNAPRAATGLGITLPTTDGLGAVVVGMTVDDQGAPDDFYFQVVSSSGKRGPQCWLPRSACAPLRAALDALPRMLPHLPEPEMDDAKCPQCHGLLVPGDGRKGAPCYECIQYRERALRARVRAGAEDGGPEI